MIHKNIWNIANVISISFKQIAKFTTIIPEQKVIIERICVVQVSSNLEFSTKIFGVSSCFSNSFVKSSKFKAKIQVLLLK